MGEGELLMGRKCDEAAALDLKCFAAARRPQHDDVGGLVGRPKLLGLGIVEHTQHFAPFSLDGGLRDSRALCFDFVGLHTW